MITSQTFICILSSSPPWLLLVVNFYLCLCMSLQFCNAQLSENHARINKRNWYALTHTIPINETGTASRSSPLVLSKSEKCSIWNDIWHRKTENCNICAAETGEYLVISDFKLMDSQRLRLHTFQLGSKLLGSDNNHVGCFQMNFTLYRHEICVR